MAGEIILEGDENNGAVRVACSHCGTVNCVDRVPVGKVYVRCRSCKETYQGKG